MLYDLVQCPHRVTMDLFGNVAARDAINSFIELLWEKGQPDERRVIQDLGVPFLDLSSYAGEEKERRTREAMVAGEPLIFSGRIQADDLLGDPDLLRRESGGYVPGDIKSGAGEEDKEDLAKPKKHYGVQLALYVDVLERLGFSVGRSGSIWDINGKEIAYDLEAPLGVRKPQSMWDEYETCLATARAIATQADSTVPAYSSMCKLCHWYSSCLMHMQETQDLTLIPGLGRPKRDSMRGDLATISELASSDPEAFISGKKTAFKGIGPDTLRTFHERAKLLTNKDAKPYLREAFALPHADKELFFDIEVDAMRDLVYLHGFVERCNQDNATEQYLAFFADSPTSEAEKQAFEEALAYLAQNSDAVIYYYSPYERTQWRKLQEKYPEACTSEELEAVFDPARAVDLYTNVVRSKTEWPTRDHSIKTLAQFLGFAWRDSHPSGAASIEWFHSWVETNDPTVKQRILDYNEDDCRATRVLLDGIRGLTMVNL